MAGSALGKPLQQGLQRRPTWRIAQFRPLQSCRASRSPLRGAGGSAEQRPLGASSGCVVRPSCCIALSHEGADNPPVLSRADCGRRARPSPAEGQRRRRPPARRAAGVRHAHEHAPGLARCILIALLGPQLLRLSASFGPVAAARQRAVHLTHPSDNARAAPVLVRGPRPSDCVQGGVLRARQQQRRRLGITIKLLLAPRLHVIPRARPARGRLVQSIKGQQAGSRTHSILLIAPSSHRTSRHPQPHAIRGLLAAASTASSVSATAGRTELHIAACMTGARITGGAWDPTYVHKVECTGCS